MFTTFQEVEVFFNSRKALGIKPGLERINHLLFSLNSPQNRIHAIHVAGTNGKGSTVQFINQALQANDYQVGVFASPSLTGLTGHIFLNNTEISKREFLSICNEIFPIIQEMDHEQMAPTEFEIITAIAFLYFSRHSDIALIEAGMGGREDTTNCFQPIISIITNVAKDHTRFLGETVEDIAYQKAGIIKANAPVITGYLTEESLKMIEKEVQKHKTVSFRLGKDFHYAYNKQLSWRSCTREIETTLEMAGEHQMQNASVALMALEILNEKGYVVSFEKGIKAIRKMKVPGRFEVIRTNPVIVLDGAHNPAGVSAFVKTVNEVFPNQEKHLLFAAFKDKDLKQMLEQLQPLFSSITVTSFRHPRAAKAEDLFKLIAGDTKKLSNDWKTVVDKMEGQQSGVYFIMGSLHFISLVRTYLVRK